MNQASNLNRLPELLRARLAESVPAHAIHERAAARTRLEAELSYGRHWGPAPARAYSAAVLMLLYPRDGAWYMPLTLRPKTMASHAGQISLPGGMIEKGETSRQAALRELEEELGVPAEGIDVLGSLSPFYVFVTNYLVTPWVAVLRHEPAWVPDPREVAETLHLPLAALQEPLAIEQYVKKVRGFEFDVPYLPLGGHRIWGATSMMLGEFAAVLAECDID